MTLRVRSATAEDLDAIWELERAVFGSDAWSRDLLCEELTGEHRRYLALVEDTTDGGAETVRGYAGLLALGGTGDVQTIALDPALHGRGHGRTLMLALAAEAEELGVRDVFLEVRADNEPARGLYRSLGFAEIGVRPRYYQPDGVDAIVMQARIAPRDADPEPPTPAAPTAKDEQ